MVKITNKEMCCGCKACANICPKQCVKMHYDEEGFCYPLVDNSMCVNCNMCNKVCPIESSIEPINASIKCYAAFCKDDVVIRNSSSGGMFYLLAKYILENGGVVFGAAYDEIHNVYHTYVEKLTDLYKLQGSKYVQSDTNIIYKKVEEFLKSGRLVYFSGTPCQIEALLKFLNNKYENLITQDIICHGVPSAKVWQSFLHSVNNSKCRKAEFRNKSKGWRNYSVKLTFENGKEYIKEKNKDLYMRSFFQNLILRPSCYDCKFKKIQRVSDITLADFWGVWDVAPEMYNFAGTSLVVLNSLKAQEIFSEISGEAVFKEVSFENSIKYNRSMFESASKSQNRQKFFGELENKEFFELSKKYCNNNNAFKRLLSKVKKYIRF